MKKKEAAQLLGVSTKAIERYTTKGKLHAQYKRKASGGQEAIYDDAEVKALKEEMEQAKQAPVKIERRDAQTRRDTSLVSALDLVFALDRLAAKIEAVQSNGRAPMLSDLAVKLTLNLSEAAALSGLPETALAAAIRKDKLKAVKIEKETRIKRAALEKYISKL